MLVSGPFLSASMLLLAHLLPSLQELGASDFGASFGLCFGPLFLLALGGSTGWTAPYARSVNRRTRA